MKKIRSYLMLGLFAFIVSVPTVAFADGAISNVYAASDEEEAKNCGSTRILGVPTWYRGLLDSDCNITTPTGDEAAIGGFVWKIVLNIIEMALAIVAYIAFGFIIYGGFTFMTSGSNPAGVEKGRKTILNAVIGLVIAIAAMALVNLIFRIVS